MFGVHYVWEFYPQWSLDAMFQFFTLKYQQQYDGNLTWRYGGVRLFFRASS